MTPRPRLYVAVKFKTRNVHFDDDASGDQRDIFWSQEAPVLANKTGAQLITSESFFCQANHGGCRISYSSVAEGAAHYVTPPSIATSCVDWTAVVEMLVCAQAASFMGTSMSTYTNGIQRLRGYYRHIAPKLVPEATLHYTMLPPRNFTRDKTPSWGGEQDALAVTWYHEWPEGWLAE